MSQPNTLNDSKQVKLKLARLKLGNFKGIKSFDLRSGGGDLSVYGDNASGKTTLADAFSWLLFGKDSQGRADFDIKTLSPSGEAMPGLEHSVKAVLSIGEETKELRKVYREKWTKRRGSADKEFTGHTRDHFIDGVPINQSDYEAQIAEIATEDIFQLLTNPIHFPERLHWQERRQLLLEICGDISDADVIVSSHELHGLPEILAGKSIDDHRKIAQARERKINEELKRIPVRIDEVSRGLPDVEADDTLTFQSCLKQLRESRTEAEAERSRITAGGEIAEKTKRLREIEAELLEESNRGRALANKEVDKLRRELSDAGVLLDSETRTIYRIDIDISRANQEFKPLERRMAELRKSWHESDAEKLNPADRDDLCMACGQKLPAERVADARKKALALFNTEKAKRLTEIVEQGKKFRAHYDGLKANLMKWQLELAEVKKHESSLSESMSKLAEKIKGLQVGEDMTEPSERSNEFMEQKRALEEHIETLRESNATALEQVAEKISNLDGHIAERESALNLISQLQAGKNRIAELKHEERRLASEYEELERQIHLIEEFTRRKVSMLTDRINSKFELARFKLFNILVNGGIEECCEVTHEGVPWPSLNTGAQVNIGLDMISTFSSHYGIAPPIFIDHSESVTELLETPGQQIRLIVSDAYKDLHVEEVK